MDRKLVPRFPVFFLNVLLAIHRPPSTGLGQGPKLQRRHSKWNRRPESNESNGIDGFRDVSGSGAPSVPPALSRLSFTSGLGPGPRSYFQSMAGHRHRPKLCSTFPK